MVSASQVVTVIAVVAVAACLQRISGFGFSLLATPLLATTMAVRDAVVVLTIVSFPATGMTWAQLREHVDRAQLIRLLRAAAFGLPVGLAVHHFVSEKGMRLVLAGVVIAAIVLLGSGWRIPIHHAERSDTIAGFCSGVLNMATGTNGPPLVLNLTSQSVAPDRMRATLSGVFAVSGVLGLALFAIDGDVGRTQLTLGAIGLPVAIVGQQLGTRAAPRVSERMFRQLTYCLLFLTAITSAVNALR